MYIVQSSITRVLIFSFYPTTQFLWRPRPPTLLTPEDEAEIAKNLRKYSRKYEVEDAEAQTATSAQDLENRRKLMEEWRSWLTLWRQQLELRDGEPSDTEEDYEAEEVEVEEIINIEEEVVGFGFEQVD
jgi:translation initiation factor 3 subunit B